MQHRDLGEPCTGCGADVLADPEESGLHCSRCGQWQVLCEECHPKHTEDMQLAPDAIWCCPECREQLDA
jgi:hypothetical protein